VRQRNAVRGEQKRETAESAGERLTESPSRGKGGNLSRVLNSFSFFLSPFPLLLQTCPPIKEASGKSAVVFGGRGVQGWLQQNQAADSAPVEFSVGLHSTNLALLEKTFWEVSDPEHENYQNYLSIDEINAMVAPVDGHMQKVKTWLAAQGVKQGQMRTFSDVIDVKVPVSVAAELFGCKFFNFIHEDKQHVVRTWGDLTIDDSVADFVSIVVGPTQFPVPHFSVQRARKQIAEGVANIQGIVPQTLHILYNIPADVLSSDLSSSQGMIEFQGQNYHSIKWNEGLLSYQLYSIRSVPQLISSFYSLQRSGEVSGIGVAE
jgi:hypothetical protein